MGQTTQVTSQAVCDAAELAADPPPERWILTYGGSARAPGRSTYAIRDFTRLAAVFDSAGAPELWLSSGAICLQLFAPSGRVFEPALAGPPADGSDWSAYLDSLFSKGGILQRLDSGVAIASATIGPPPTPYQVSVMIPYPDSRDSGFAFEGAVYQLWNAADRRDVTLAYVAEVKRRFETERLAHLSLNGFYWSHELMPDSDSALVTAVGNAVHQENLRLLWIPYYDAEGWDRWWVWFDEAWLQPNYFFDLTVPATRLDSAAAHAVGAEMGLEIEFDGRVFDDPQFGDRLGPYLSTLASNPELRDRSIAIYDGQGALVSLSRSTAAPLEALYRQMWMALVP
ncbi:MAG TPA: DUF4855 domain-containing protein [Gemmatimonadales bacterium]|nr:DUF4855 domain-containing protein [Gemmatimonadales bacterium]